MKCWIFNYTILRTKRKDKVSAVRTSMIAEVTSTTTTQFMTLPTYIHWPKIFWKKSLFRSKLIRTSEKKNSLISPPAALGRQRKMVAIQTDRGQRSTRAIPTRRLSRNAVEKFIMLSSADARWAWLYYPAPFVSILSGAAEDGWSEIITKQRAFVFRTEHIYTYFDFRM